MTAVAIDSGKGKRCCPSLENVIERLLQAAVATAVHVRA